MQNLRIICCLLFIIATNAYGRENSSLSILDIKGTQGNIEMIISALDEQGNPIKGISKEDLSLTIEGEEFTEFSIEPISSAKNPISIILAIDISGSMHGLPISEAKKAASIFLDQLDKKDFTALVAFGSSVKVLSDFTREKYKIRELIEGLKAKEQLTWLYKATSDSLDIALRSPTSRVAIILLTDGKDEGSPGKEEDILKGIKRVHVPVYAIGFGPQAEIDYLKALANMSEGYFLYTPKAEELTKLYSMVLDQLKNQYLIKFILPNTPGDYICILSLNYKGSEISARRSYLHAIDESEMLNNKLKPLNNESKALTLAWFKNPSIIFFSGLAIIVIIGWIGFLFKRKRSSITTKAEINVMINKKIHPLTFNADILNGTATIIQPIDSKGQVVLQFETKPLPLIFPLMDKLANEDINEVIITRYNEKKSKLYSKNKTYILLADKIVSRPDDKRMGHARIFKDMDAGIYKIEDLGSTQGTKINGKSCGVKNPCSLENGDIIRIGNMDMKYFDQRQINETIF